MAIELKDADERAWADYKRLGTPEEIRSKHSDLEADNARSREKRRALERDKERLEEQLQDAKKGAPEGSIQLTPEQAKAWKAYEALGKPEDLEKLKTKNVELEKQVADSQQTQSLEAAATAAGYNVAALKKLAGSSALKFEVRKEKVDGEDVELAYVTENKQGATPQKLTDYVDAMWPEFVSSLEAGGDEEREERPRAPKKEGTPFPPQKARGGTKRGQATEDEVRKATLATVDYTL